MQPDQDTDQHLDEGTCYEWGDVFASPWVQIVADMRSRAAKMGLEQDSGDGCLIWKRGGRVAVRWLFVDDPSNINALRRIYSDEANVAAPVCFIVVRQPDPSDTRGDIIFDIFRMNSKSYLWHFYRVFTPPPPNS